MDVDDEDIVMAEADPLPIDLPKKRKATSMTINLPPIPSLNPFDAKDLPIDVPEKVVDIHQPPSFNAFEAQFAKHLEHTHTAGFRDRFESDEDFEAQKAEYLARHNNREKAEVNLAKYPNCLDDLPTTHEERVEWRRQLFGAIRDFTMVANQGRRKAGANGQAANAEIENTDVRRCRELDDFEVEMIVYEILRKAEKAHKGQVDIGAWTESQQWGFEQFPSFAARMHWLLRAVRVNKAVPMDYCEPDFLMRWACAPEKETKKFEENLRAAAHKRELLRRAREGPQG